MITLPIQAIDDMVDYLQGEIVCLTYNRFYSKFLCVLGVVYREMYYVCLMDTYAMKAFGIPVGNKIYGVGFKSEGAIYYRYEEDNHINDEVITLDKFCITNPSSNTNNDESDLPSYDSFINQVLDKLGLWHKLSNLTSDTKYTLGINNYMDIIYLMNEGLDKDLGVLIKSYPSCYIRNS